MRGRLTIILGLVISAAALWVVIRSVNVGATVSVLESADLRVLLLILVAVTAQVVLRAIRWSHLIPATPRVPVRRLLPPLLIGYLGNAVLPARLGEPMRAAIVSRRERIDMVQALGTVLLERVIDVATLAPIALIAALVTGAPAWAVQLAAVATVIGSAIILVLATTGIEPLLRMADRWGLAKRPSVRATATRLARVLGGSSMRRPIALAAAISSSAWLLDAGSFWLAAHALGIELGYAGAMLIAAIAVLGTAIPSAPGYVGTFELAASSVAVALGVPAESAVALAIVAHAMTLVPVAAAGAVSLAVTGSSVSEVAAAARRTGVANTLTSREA
jgi:glycosyltransferase 2 family protein